MHGIEGRQDCACHHLRKTRVRPFPHPADAGSIVSPPPCVSDDTQSPDRSVQLYLMPPDQQQCGGFRLSTSPDRLRCRTPTPGGSSAGSAHAPRRHTDIRDQQYRLYSVQASKSALIFLAVTSGRQSNSTLLQCSGHPPVQYFVRQVERLSRTSLPLW